ncbi:uncharacterized protein LOC135811339 [Sycon ciliatum]|uniref:uncharacterized protein LOC135811339 n=1 Tax=Sycon ciliatum TaxID=27933 RepID=UPI0031F5F385
MGDSSPLPRQDSNSSSSPGTSRRPRILGRQYQLLQRLGQGSFGVAYMVKDIKSDKNSDDSLKVLKEIFIGDKLPDNGLDAVREAKLLSKLSHPNIVKYHSSFVQGEMFCIVTEYCDNGDLNMLVKRVRKEGKRFEEKLVVTYFVQLLMAIKYMHDRKLLHRDIKASNIFLRNNVIKLGDFGITRLLERTTDMASTFTGTPNYMSPEVVQHQGYNSKSDIWSVGCVLYEMCALSVTFQAGNLLALMKKIVYEDAPTLPRTYSPDLCDIFNMMMEKDTAKRASALTLLRHRYIVKHVSNLKEQILDQQTAAEKDTSEIVQALSGYSHSRKQRRQEVESKAEATHDDPVGDSAGDRERSAISPPSAVAAASNGSPTTKGKKRAPVSAGKTASSSGKAKTPGSAKSKPLQKDDVSRSPRSSAKAAASPAKPSSGANKTPKKKKVEKLPAKVMTPREQLQQRKRLKADQEAGRLKVEGRKYYTEQKRTYAENRRQNNVKRPPPWVAENPDICESGTLFSITHPAPDDDDDDSDAMCPVSPPQSPRNRHHPNAPAGKKALSASGNSSSGERQFLSQHDYDEMPVGGSPSPRPSQSRTPDRAQDPSVKKSLFQDSSKPAAHAESSKLRFDGKGGQDPGDITFSDLTLDDVTVEGISSAGMQLAQAVSSPRGRGGASPHYVDPTSTHYIPEDPDEADELYTREADFESDSDGEISGKPIMAAAGSDADSIEDEITGGNGRVGGGGGGGSDGEEEEDDGRDDMAALVDYMNNALELTMHADDELQSMSASQRTFHDLDSLSISDPQQKIQQLRADCIQVLGEEDFVKVYKFLQSAHFGPVPLGEAELRAGLAKLVSSVRDCFRVEQLIFLEHDTTMK